MNQNAPQRLYLMQVGSVPEYQIPIVCYLVQTGDGKNILIDSGLPEIMPEGYLDFANGQDVIAQLASLGLQPEDIDTVISTHYDGDHAGSSKWREESEGKQCTRTDLGKCGDPCIGLRHFHAH